MSKSLNKLAYSVLEEVSSFELNDDFPITLSLVEDQIISQNHTLLRKAHKERRIDEMLYMYDEELPLKEFDKTIEIEGITIENDTDFCYVEIKSLVTGLKGLEIDVVSNAGYTKVFNRTSFKRLLRGSSGYYKLGKPEYAIIKDKLFFRAKEVAGMKVISINAIWGDPRKVSSWNPDASFPTPSEKNLETLTVQHIAHGFQFPADLINDGQRAYSQQKPPSNED